MAAVPVGERRAGRPRSSAADRAILDAAVEIYAERGLDGFTVDDVAALAGVSKATIYRRYPGKVDLVMAAAQTCCDEMVIKPDTGDLRADLLVALTRLGALMRDPIVGRAARSLVSDAHRDEQLARLHREFVATRRARTMAMLRAAQGRGELRADLDVAVGADMLVGPLFYRFLVSGEPIDDAYVASIVQDFLRANTV